MKTQIIQLETHDDIISTRDKMGWSQTSRILLVWPEKGHILNRRLDLIMLARHSRALGCQLALVTTNSEVKYHANKLGLPVYPTLSQAQSAHWRSSFSRKSRILRRSPLPDLESLRAKAKPKQAVWINHRFSYWIAFLFSLVALLALAIVLLPGATIELVPSSQVQELTIPVQAGEAFSTLNLSGNLPAHWVTITVEGRSAITTTGTVMTPVSPASGKVQFINLSEEQVIIPAGTLVSTLGSDPIWFSTTQEGKAPPGIGKSVTIPVQAVRPGSSGNLPAGEIRAVSGSLGLQLNVNNLSPTRNGVDQPAPAPTVQDRNRLYNQMLNSLQQTASQELQNRYTKDLLKTGFPILSSLRLSEIIEKTFVPAEDTPAEYLQLSLRLEFKALEVSPLDLQNLVVPLLNASLPDAYIALPETLNVTILKEITLDEKDIAHFTLQSERKIEAVVSPEATIQLARGLPLATAVQRLRDQLPLERTPRIQPTPSWWPYTPFLPLRITVRIVR